MTTKETKLFELLDIAIEYIQNIADEDSPTLEYLIEQYQTLAEQGE